MTPTKLFISYSHEDESYIKEFRSHITPLLNKGLISDWYDRKIKPGEVLSEEIENNMQTSDIICLFISAKFLESPECNKEKEKALEIRKKKDIAVIPTILLPCAWKDDSSIAELKASTTDAKPVVEFDPRDKGWLEVYEGLKEVINSKNRQEKSKINWEHYPNSRFLALVALIGAWSDDNNQSDHEVISKLLGNKAGYNEWLSEAQNRSDSPLSLKDGIWEVHNRAEIWQQIGSYVTSSDFNDFKELAVSILKKPYSDGLYVFKKLAVSMLKEPDAALELSAEERDALSTHRKAAEYSPQLRKGIAEGLAILGSMPDSNGYQLQKKIEETCILAVREILSDADWIRSSSLNDSLPALAEAAPDEFLRAVEKILDEGNGITNSNCLTGLLWALEALAWDKQYLVRACVMLGGLASHYPGNLRDHRPFNSLVNILLPWFPQTEDTNKCRVAVKTLLKEYPDVAWNLMIQLLPNQRDSSYGSFKPKWRKIIPDDQGKNITNEEYWKQVSFYAKLAINNARIDDTSYDIDRLVGLIDCCDELSQPEFDKFMRILSSDTIIKLPEEQRQRLWEHLTKLINKHQRFTYTEWIVPDEQIMRIDKIAEQIIPTKAFNRHQRLFNNCDFDIYEEHGNYDKQRKKLDKKRDTAISEIFQKNGIEGVISFAASVASPEQVGFALGAIPDKSFEQTLIPKYLDTSNDKHKALAGGFIRRCHNDRGWQWCNNIDRSDWTPAQTGQFLAFLPFVKETWDRATEWLQDHEDEYWSRTRVNYKTNDDITSAIEKLIKHGRPHAAIQCLSLMRHAKQQISTEQCVQALLDALSSDEPIAPTNEYFIVELIKFIQTESSVKSDDLFNVEWEYLPLFNSYKVVPQCLENRLAKEPEFFCEVIQFRFKNKDQLPKKPTEESIKKEERAWRLLNAWKTPPGMQEDGIFNAELFDQWLQKVKELCKESGHLDVALISIGEVLIHTPADPHGLWIHRAVATVLNKNNHEADKMRRGFYNGTFNSHGFHRIDPTGKPEKDLAEQFRNKAEEIENADFHRFAKTLRYLAEDYDDEAKRIISESANIEK